MEKKFIKVVVASNEMYFRELEIPHFSKYIKEFDINDEELIYEIKNLDDFHTLVSPVFIVRYNDKKDVDTFINNIKSLIKIDDFLDSILCLGIKIEGVSYQESECFILGKLPIFKIWERISDILVKLPNVIESKLVEEVKFRLKRFEDGNGIYLNVEEILYLQELRYRIECMIENSSLDIESEIDKSIILKIFNDILDYKSDEKIIDEICYAGSFNLYDETWGDIKNSIAEYI